MNTQAKCNWFMILAAPVLGVGAALGPAYRVQARSNWLP